MAVFVRAHSSRRGWRKAVTGCAPPRRSPQREDFRADRVTPKATGGSSPAPRRRSVDSSSLRDDRRWTARRGRTATGEAVLILIRSPRPRLPTATAHYSETSRALFDVSFARAPGLQPSEPTASAALFLGNETALCPRARQRFVADGCCARVLVVSDLSSTSKLVELAFCYDRVMCLSNEPI